MVCFTITARTGMKTIKDITGNSIEVTDLDAAIGQCEFCIKSPFKMESGHTVGENHTFILKQLLNIRRNTRTGIYSIKSPYHKKKMFLPFIILSHSESDHTYEVQTVEYRGMKRYKIHRNYGEGTIGQLIRYNDITKCTEIAELPTYRNSKCKVGKLIALYYNVKEKTGWD